MGPIARPLGVLITILSLASPSLARPHRWRNLVLAGALAPDPSNPGTLYICSGTTLFRSTDSGVDWTITGILAGGARALAVAPTLPATLFAANDDGLFKSTDAGATWALATSGSPTTPDGFDGVTALPGDPVRVLAVAYALSTGDSDGVYESTDGGSSWSLLDVPGGAIRQIASPAQDPQTLYAAAVAAPSGAAGGGLFRSEDGGASWTALLGGPGGPIDVRAIAIDPADPSILYAAAQTGLLRSADRGISWTALAGGLPAGGAVSALVNPGNSQWLYAGSAQGGIFRSFDSGVTWYPMIERWPEGFTGHDLFVAGGSLYATTAVGEYAWDLTADTCAPDANTLCLNEERFLVQAQWTDFQGGTGKGSVVPNAASNESGVLWFFGPDNWELLIKVLNGCGVNGHYWVFGAAATDVAYVIQVTDTLTGEVRTYINPLGTRSPAITDTEAFESCP